MPASAYIEKSENFEPECIKLQTEGQKVVRVEASISIIAFRDKDTNMYVSYAPSLEVSGYGDTIKESQEMIKSSLDEMLEILQRNTVKDVKDQLIRLGWRQNRWKNKIYSRAYVDPEGELKNFNVDLSTVSRTTLAVA